MWAEICSDGETDPGSECCQSASEQQQMIELAIEHEQLKKQIRDLRGDLQEREPPLPSPRREAENSRPRKGVGLKSLRQKAKRTKGAKLASSAHRVKRHRSLVHLTLHQVLREAVFIAGACHLR